MSTRDEETVRYWLTEKGEAAVAALPRCGFVGCTRPATGTGFSYAALGFVPACPAHGGAS